jgi:predicted AAA+ superfamily ATPase
LNKTEIARDVGVSLKTITQWLSVLEASNQITLLEPYFVNVGKRLVKSPKLYFCDTGLLCFLLGYNDQALLAASPHVMGSLWETFIYSEIRKHMKARPTAYSLWFYRDNIGREVDFVLQGRGRLDLLECKWTEIPSTSDVKWLSLVGTDMKELGRKFLVCRTPQNFPLDRNVQAIHGLDLTSRIDL